MLESFSTWRSSARFNHERLVIPKGHGIPRSTSSEEWIGDDAALVEIDGWKVTESASSIISRQRRGC